MAASQVQCQACGTVFRGRADARYCSNACRQKAHRTRTARRAAENTVSAPELSTAIMQARYTRQLARTARERAKEARRVASQAREEACRSAR